MQHAKTYNYKVQDAILNKTETTHYLKQTQIRILNIKMVKRKL